MKDYMELALRTVAESDDNLLHAAMGICTETIEMETAGTRGDYLEEAGDTLWYVSLGCHTLGVSLNEAEEMAEEGHVSSLALAGDFMNQMKRFRFYGTPHDHFKLAGILGSLLISLRTDIEASDASMTSVMEANIEKLRKRYPDKFDTRRAINR